MKPLRSLRRVRPQPHARARVVQEGTDSPQGNASVCGGFLKLQQGLQGGRQRHGRQRQAHGHVGIYFRKRVEHGEQEGFVRKHHCGSFQVGIFGQSIAHPGAGRFGQPNGAGNPLNFQAFGPLAQGVGGVVQIHCCGRRPTVPKPTQVQAGLVVLVV